LAGDAEPAEDFITFARQMERVCGWFAAIQNEGLDAILFTFYDKNPKI
jgi:hypothetical protein